MSKEDKYLKAIVSIKNFYHMIYTHIMKMHIV